MMHFVSTCLAWLLVPAASAADTLHWTARVLDTTPAPGQVGQLELSAQLQCEGEIDGDLGMRCGVFSMRAWSEGDRELGVSPASSALLESLAARWSGGVVVVRAQGKQVRARATPDLAPAPQDRALDRLTAALLARSFGGIPLRDDPTWTASRFRGADPLSGRTAPVVARRFERGADVITEIALQEDELEGCALSATHRSRPDSVVRQASVAWLCISPDGLSRQLVVSELEARPDVLLLGDGGLVRPAPTASGELATR